MQMTPLTYSASYFAVVLLLLGSLASTAVSPRSNWSRIGTPIRILCLSLAVLVAMFTMLLKSSDVILALKITILAVVCGVARWITMFARRQAWWNSWTFFQPLVSNRRLGPTVSDKWGPRNLLQSWQSNLRLQGWSLTILGLVIAMLMSWVSIYLFNRVVGPRASLFASPLVAYGGIVLFDWGRRLSLRGRRLQAQAHIIRSPKEVSAGTYVLYLRPFYEDQRRSVILPTPVSPALGGLMQLFPHGGSEEEQMADAVRPVGNMVAVGIPEEVTPHAGAMRMYLPLDDWKGPVGQLIERARLVVIWLGSTPATIWEVAQAMCTVPPQRLLILVPFQMKNEEYERLRKRVLRELKSRSRSRKNITWNGKLPTLPPRPLRDPDAPEIGFIHFIEGWEARTSCEIDFGGSGALLGNFFSCLARGMRGPFEELVSFEERTGRQHG
ncbi:hypothetical protein [Streptomyces rubrogriseus]|uniref:Transferase n=1 Tax=Streptomyces rubrogriseus TaxID=194673 RepID=A0A6G3TR65_9ACTN|nr:hypothetical protein [Streptomyces rubrogriseus]NEC39124.1 hypothetical protein [Streptomyces rubrogriseus]